ncbi:hypothetical protein BRD56_09395 [Thermoplasmatales archaeon SW_10_69_26]|nr:MAG: hypothetical protein BRD56_09395 [Thermoplasmatales archaeon SW_10_69_26]
MTGGARTGTLAKASLAIILALAGGSLMFDEARAAARDDCFVEEPHVDVGFVLDESGSMDGEKIEAAKNGALDLTDSLTDEQYSGLVSFDYSAYLRQSVSPDHNATASAIENLTAGGGTATGDGINLSHEDLNASGLDQGRDVMIVLADGNTNAGSDPVVEAEEAKADGIEIFTIAFGDGADEDELKQIASQPTDEHFYDASTEDIEQVFLQLAGNVTDRNDTQEPTLSYTTPEEGHKYVNGVDQGPGTGAYADRATLVGDLRFEAAADDNCYLHDVALDVPGTSWSYAENATNITTSTFPATSVGAGNYTLDGQAIDWVGLTTNASADLHVPDVPPPAFTEGPCVTGETVEGLAGLPLAFPVEADSPEDVIEVDLALASAPAGLTLEGDLPADPARANVTWTDPVKGTYQVAIEATDELGQSATCIVDLVVEDVPAEARTVGLWTGFAAPEHVEYRSEGVHLVGSDLAESHRQATLDDGASTVHAEGVDERGRLTYQAPDLQAHGYSEIAEIELLDGLVRAESLVHEASVGADVVNGTAQLVDEQRRIERLVVDGTEIDVDDRQGPIEVDLPGEGYVRLFEREVETGEGEIRYRSNLIHVVAPDGYGREEIIVGDVHLAAPGPTFTDQDRELADQDDADSGRDATDEDPVAITPGLYDAGFAPGDREDTFALEAEHGDKITVELEPATRARLAGASAGYDGTPTASSPEPDVGLPTMTVELYDPEGQLRAQALLDGTHTAQRVEMNADIDGTWTVVVDQLDAFREGPFAFHAPYTFYSFEATITPVPLLPQSDALSGADAPATCQAPAEDIPEITDGQWAGVIREDDQADVYRFEADIGDLVTATLKPGETTDGVAMAFTLYDEDCRELDRSNLGGPYTLKGRPEAVRQLPSHYTGTYYLAIERVNGVGNHHVTLSVRDPMPGLVTNDARTGQDADDDPDNATQAPPLAFQGTLEDGDDGDAYALDLTAGTTSTVALEMSTGSQVQATLIEPDGTTRDTTASLANGTFVWSFETRLTGDHVLVVEPVPREDGSNTGGGDYTVTWGQIPLSVTSPLAQRSGLPSASIAP